MLIGPFWRGVAILLSILAAAKQGVYSQEYTARGIPRALLVGLLIEVLGLHLMDPGMDRRAAVFFTSNFGQMFRKFLVELGVTEWQKLVKSLSKVH